MNITEAIQYHTDNSAALEIDKRYTLALEKIDELSDSPVVQNENEYLSQLKVKEFLCALSCYTSKTKHPLNDRVWELESVYGIALSKYNKRSLIKNKDIKYLAKYLSWPYFYTKVIDHQQALKAAAAYGILRKNISENSDGSTRTELYVIGLHYKVGDNTFSVDSRGREHRRYIKTMGRQALPVVVPHDEYKLFIEREKEAVSRIPELHNSFYVTYVGDGKGCIRAIPMSNTERNFIIQTYPAH
ncbi:MULTISPECIES: hypothetical protein [Vibrio]|uniref:hypothetical protein n=1 Tax=Vibrio TaxID=662 RepID=UPI002075CC26|nr:MULTISPECIES: hypothetical protein [Vibrio]USD35634.1 hypothetical protein J8Z27_22765 [Vibrio sp. SCSIO 43186]USD72758.1 hypothetical protein J4N41_22770 [Vibrio sp. SCSIO 43139]USD98963.1 hypothetical protein CTT30_23095 [Vibrio coralliilyticus]